MSEKIYAPFTEEQVRELNGYQNSGGFCHPYTCCGGEGTPGCTRRGEMVNGIYVGGTSDGELVATVDGWVCPCGEYKQNWAHG